MGILRFAAAVATICAACLLAVPASAGDYATKDEAVAMVKKAIARVQAVGIEQAKPEFMDHSGPYVDRDLYVVVIDQAGMRIAHGQNPKMVGTSYYDSVDAAGTEYGKEAAKIVAGPGSGWYSYVFKDPITGKLLPKTAYIEKAGDYAIMVGAYTR